MIRKSSFNKNEPIVRMAFQRFFQETKFNAFDIGDWLVCSQRGTLDFANQPIIGLGKTGINNYQKVNMISNIGENILVDDDDYFANNGYKSLTGTSQFERGISQVCSMYLDIWENELFLRDLAELIRVANGKHYDWKLTFDKTKDSSRNHFIREQIINELDAYPYLQEIIKTGYNGNLRNVIAHSQYHVVPGGLWFDNYKRGKYNNEQGIPFEKWEKTILYGWLIFRVVFTLLSQISKDIFFKFANLGQNKGIPVLIPVGNENGWYKTLLYPDKKGEIWRFVRTE